VTFRVDGSAFVMSKVSERFGASRSVDGAPSGYDVIGGPLAAAVVEFAHFDELPEAAGPAVRTLQIVDPFLGVVVFTAVATGENLVEVADFADDPDYWDLIRADPTD
jgi:hypothetical protein